MNPSLPEIYRHLEWADGLIWTSVVAASVDGADEALLTTLHHAHIAQRAFLQLWTGEPVSVPQLDEFANPSDLMAWARGYHTEVQAFLHTAPDLDRLVEVPWGGQFAERHGHPMTHATLGQTAQSKRCIASRGRIPTPTS